MINPFEFPLRGRKWRSTLAFLFYRIRRLTWLAMGIAFVSILVAPYLESFRPSMPKVIGKIIFYLQAKDCCVYIGILMAFGFTELLQLLGNTLRHDAGIWLDRLRNFLLIGAFGYLMHIFPQYVTQDFWVTIGFLAFVVLTRFVFDIIHGLLLGKRRNEIDQLVSQAEEAKAKQSLAEAEELLEKSLRLFPQNVKAMSLLAQIYESEKGLEEAHYVYRSALQVGRRQALGDPKVQDELREIRHLLKEMKEAEAAID